MKHRKNEYFRFLDTQKSQDIIMIFYRFRQKFNVDEQTASKVISEWVESYTI